MKKLMILGAGIYQVPLIKAAKQYNCEVIVVTIPGNYPGIKFADKVYYVDTREYDKILKIAKDENIDGITTTGTDVAIKSVGYVCDHLNLCGLTSNSAQKCTNKLEMKIAFNDIVRNSEFKKVEINSEFKPSRFPVMFKAVDSSGSRGIIKVNSPNDVSNAICEIKNITKQSYYLVEEFLEGKEIGCDALVVDSNILFIAPHDKITYHSLADVPIGHIFPFECSQELYEDILQQMEAGIRALGLNNCAVNADIMIKDNKAYIIEMGGRCGATGIPELLSIIYGIDFYQIMVKLALGETITEKFIPQKLFCASELLYSEVKGKITSISVIDLNSDDIRVSFDYNEGDYIEKFKTGNNRIGQIIVVAKNSDDLNKKMILAKNSIKIVIDGD